MGGIFPPSDKGGRPPGGNVCNGYSPTHKVVGEGPLYIAADCTTVLTDCNFNSIVSEISAAIDQVDGGIPYNSHRVDNLAQALTAAFNAVNQRIAAKVSRAGDTMEGPLVLSRDPQDNLEAVTKRYSDNANTALDIALRAYVDGETATMTTDFQTRINQVDARKVNRIGDTMQGALMLARQPVFAMEAVPKSYVDNEIANIPSGGGDGGGVVVGMVPEAPYDDVMYGRINRTWQRISLDDGEY